MIETNEQEIHHESFVWEATRKRSVPLPLGMRYVLRM